MTDSSVQAHNVLVLGSSSAQFPAAHPELALPPLLKAELQARDPQGNWDVSAALLYPSADMATRGAALIDHRKPDVAVFICAGTYADETVLVSINRRWPRLRRPASAISKWFEGPRGEPGGKSRSPRDLAFGPVHAAARKVFGVAAIIDLATAIEVTVETLRALAAVPGLTVVVRLTAGGTRDPSAAEEEKRRIAEFNSAVGAECERLGIWAFEPRQEMEAAGLEYAYEPDLIHGNLAARTFTAQLVAGVILERRHGNALD